MCLLSMGNMPVFAVTESVDIGIFYGNNSQYPAGISSDTGFDLIIEKNGLAVSEVNLTNYKSLKVYKAGFYVSDILQTGAQSYYSNGNVKGAFTNLIGLPVADVSEIIPQFQAYKIIAPNIALFYNGNWQISYGTYLTLADAQNDVASIKALIPETQVVSTQVSKSQMIAYDGTTPLISYDTSAAEVVFKAAQIQFNDVTYRDGVMFKRLTTSDYSVINHIEMDHYLYGVLPKEMSTSWPLEALKAQAIAARNYTLINLNKHSAMGFDLCNTTDCQVYGGLGVEGAISNQAVDETSGLILTYQGEIASCYYHSNSGGETEDISNIWTGDLPYIYGKTDPYSIGQPNDSWTLTLSAAQISEALKAYGKDIGSYQSVSIGEVSEHGRILKITFVGSGGSATLLKEEMRRVFGNTTLKSMYFSLSPPEIPKFSVQSSGGLVDINTTGVSVMTTSGIVSLADNAYVQQVTGLSVLSGSLKMSSTSQSSGSSLTLYGKGYGHGLGMSQWGAKGMADAGKTFADILTFYFTGTQISVR